VKLLLTLAIVLALTDFTASSRAGPSPPLKEINPAAPKQGGGPAPLKLTPLKQTSAVSSSPQGPYCHYAPNRYQSFLGTSVWSAQSAKLDAVDQASQWCGRAGGVSGACSDEHPRCAVSVEESGAGTESKALKYQYQGTFRCTASCER
jgi:hypothetical protein